MKGEEVFYHMGIKNIIHISVLEANYYSTGKHRQKVYCLEKYFRWLKFIF